LDRLGIPVDGGCCAVGKAAAQALLTFRSGTLLTEAPLPLATIAISMLGMAATAHGG